jgi:hypothetical protein
MSHHSFNHTNNTHNLHSPLAHKSNHTYPIYKKKYFNNDKYFYNPNKYAYGIAIPAFFYSQPIAVLPVEDDSTYERIDIPTTIFLTSIASIGIFALYQLTQRIK